MVFQPVVIDRCDNAGECFSWIIFHCHLVLGWYCSFYRCRQGGWHCISDIYVGMNLRPLRYSVDFVSERWCNGHEGWSCPPLFWGCLACFMFCLGPKWLVETFVIGWPKWWCLIFKHKVLAGDMPGDWVFFVLHAIVAVIALPVIIHSPQIANGLFVC